MNNNNNSGSIGNMLNRIVNGNIGNNGNNAASRSAAASSAAAAAKKKKKASIKRPSVTGRTANQVSAELDRYCREVMAQKVMEAEEKCKNMGEVIQKYMEKKAAVAKQASVKKAKLTAKNHLAALNAKEKEYRALRAQYPNYKTAKVNTATRKKLKEIPERLEKLAEKRKELEAALQIEEQKAPLLAQLAALNALAPPKKAAAPKKQASQKMAPANRAKILKSRISMNVSEKAFPDKKQRASMKGSQTRARKELQSMYNQGLLNNNGEM